MATESANSKLEGRQIDQEALNALSKLTEKERDEVFKKLARESQPPAPSTVSQEVVHSVGLENGAISVGTQEAVNQDKDLATGKVGPGDSLQLLEELDRKRKETLEQAQLYDEKTRASGDASDTLENLLQ